jgi:hypothetical protein
MILGRALDIIPDNTSGLRTALSRRQVPCYVKKNDGSLYFEYPIVLPIIIISTKGYSSGKEVVLAVIQAIVMQEQNTIIKAPDLYYKDKSKLDSFLILIDIYIFFN